MSPNAVSILGQIPVTVFLLYVLLTRGAEIGPEHPLTSQECYISALCVQWFSMIDIVDGKRAVRTRNCSPLGRIIDEAGDVVVQASYGILMAYLLGFNHFI